MSRYAIIETVLAEGQPTEVVANVIEAASWPDGILLDESLNHVGIGWHYANGEFTAPPVPAPAAPAPVVRHITKLAFDNRFLDSELVAVKLSAVIDPAGTPEQKNLAANLAVMRDKVNNASYIDLDRADTRAGVQQLEAIGLLAAGRAAIILDTPVRADEIPNR